MRKFAIKALMVLCGLLTQVPAVQAQMMPLPVDPNVRIGKLPNGLTYYIRHNETPKGQADFYIAQKVGSILEEDNQRGLAHFLEHMCFNGTENFPGHSMVSWLESIGVKFGINLNARTGVDETIYNISNVPVDRESVQDSCLLVLHDWASALTLDTEEINKERGVIHEEWRGSNVGQERIMESLLPVMYPDSKYGYRLPIGTMEVVDNFDPQVLRDYYEAWYRPDQQGIIVVGDIDVDRIENKIKEIFSPIKMPENAPERVYIEVADTPGTIYAIGKDKEQTISLAQLMIKTDVFPDSLRNDASYLAYKYIMSMVTSMLNTRLNDMLINPETPFAQAGVFYGMFYAAKTKNALTVAAVAKDNDIRPAFESAYRELLRAARGGFTASEYDRARSEYLSRYEKIYNERNNRQTAAYVNEYVKNFTDGDPIPDIETEYQLMNMIVNQIPVEAINQTLAQIVLSSPDNRVFLGLFPDNDVVRVPTEGDIAEVIAKVDGETIEAFVDDVKTEPLIAQLPAPGKIVSEKPVAQWGATELTLSNGVKVLVKSTKFKDDEILFDAQALGGTSCVSDDLSNELHMMDVALSASGLGSYNNKDLSKYLAGKQAGVSVSITDYTRDVSGNSTVKDLPTMMELLYMTFTNLTVDPAEYDAVRKQIAVSLAFQEKDPMFIFKSNLYKTLYNSPRRQMLDSEIVESANLDKMLEIIHGSLANAADYTFVFVGNIDMETFRPLVEQYIATLPADVAKVNSTIKINPALEVNPGRKTDTFTTVMENPQTYVAFIASDKLPFTSKDAKLASIVGQILGNRLLATVREDMGAVYSIGAAGYMGRINDLNVTVESMFPMKPEMKDEVLDIIAKEFKDMESNITNDEVSKAVEYMVKNANEQLELNRPWMNSITGSLINGVDTFNGAVDTLNSITVEDVQNFMKHLNNSGNYRVVVLEPAPAE
ncbi:MAG: insulinase family protein [Bacteroidales bacterium]|nr:insulinase family protein [Bacteroidales bacterium]